MKYLKLFIFLAFVIMEGCNSSESDAIELFVSSNDFPEKVKLKNGEKLSFNILNPSSIDIIDSLVIISSYDENPRFSVYNIKNKTYIKGFGSIGRGPNEYSAPEWNGQYFTDNNGEVFIYLYEFGYGTFHKLNFTSLISKNSESVEKTKYYLPPEVLNADNVYFRSDSVLAEATYNLDVKYFDHKIGSDKFTPIGQFNNSDIFEKATTIDQKINLDRSFLGYSLNRSRFVAGYLRFNKIMIMDENMDEISVIYYGDEIKGPSNVDFLSKNNFFYFRKPFAGEDLIYIPYVGVKNSERTYPKELQVYDYDGKPIKKYLFDKEFTTFTVDEKNKKLYVITNSETSQYMSYDL